MLPKHHSETFHWKVAASTVDAARRSDSTKFINMATEYMAKALATEGMDR
jgi:hypothetical protein